MTPWTKAERERQLQLARRALWLGRQSVVGQRADALAQQAETPMAHA